jgi:hypothetical protein
MNKCSCITIKHHKTGKTLAFTMCPYCEIYAGDWYNMYRSLSKLLAAKPHRFIRNAKNGYANATALIGYLRT